MDQAALDNSFGAKAAICGRPQGEQNKGLVKPAQTWQDAALNNGNRLPKPMRFTNSMSIPLESRERREWIKYQLRLRGSSLAQVAREQGVSRDASTLALRKPYPRMERALAKALGLKPEQIWPERYDANGRPNRPLGRPRKKTDSEPPPS
jgi:Ner family transcriptional regulator